MIGNNSSGFINEQVIIDYLNHEKFKDLNDNMKELLRFTYEIELEDEDIIQASKVGKNTLKKEQKPDVEVVIKDIKKYISVKKGSGNSVHQENVNEFVSFLRSNGMEESNINYLLEYHYGDETIDGSGLNRMKLKDWKKTNENNQQKIIEVNRALNEDYDFTKKIITRVLFKGTCEDNLEVDVIYHGNLEKGVWASREEIIDCLREEKYSDSGVRIRKLNYQVWNRNLGGNPETEYKRKDMQVKWSTMVTIFNKIIGSR